MNIEAQIEQLSAAVKRLVALQSQWLERSEPAVRADYQAEFTVRVTVEALFAGGQPRVDQMVAYMDHESEHLEKQIAQMGQPLAQINRLPKP